MILANFEWFGKKSRYTGKLPKLEKASLTNGDLNELFVLQKFIDLALSINGIIKFSYSYWYCKVLDYGPKIKLNYLKTQKLRM